MEALCDSNISDGVDVDQITAVICGEGQQVVERLMRCR